MITIPEVALFSESIIPQAERDRFCAIFTTEQPEESPGLKTRATIFAAIEVVVARLFRGGV
jgi:hypothetical protein